LSPRWWVPSQKLNVTEFWMISKDKFSMQRF